MIYFLKKYMRYLKKMFIFAVFIFSVNNVSAKDLYLNNTWNGDCLTENTACSSIENALAKAENWDIIYLKTDITFQWNNTWIFDLKWVTIEWNNNRLTLRGQDINLLWDVTLNELDLSILPDWSQGWKIFMNWKNLTLNSIKTQTQANDVLPTIVAWSKENTWNFSDFNLVIWGEPRWDNHFAEIITSWLDSKAVPVNVTIWEWVKVGKVKSIWNRNWNVLNYSTKTTDFENLLLLELWLKSFNDFSLKNIQNLKINENSDIPVSVFENISFLTLDKNIILSLKNSWDIKIENLNSKENNTIKLLNNNTFSVKNLTLNSNLKFEIDSEEEKVFVVIPKDKEHNISWENKTWLKIFGKISEENWFSKFWLKAKEESEELKNLKIVLDEYENLTEEQKNKVDVKIYNDTFDLHFNKSENKAEILENIKKLKAEIQKAKWEKTDEQILTEKKAELKKMLDKANLAETVKWKTEASIKKLNDIKTESQKIYDKLNSTLDEIKNEISKLDDAIKKLENKIVWSPTWNSWNSSSSPASSNSSSSFSSWSAPSKSVFLKNTETKNILKKDEKKVENKTEKTEKTEKIENKNENKIENKKIKTINILWKERKYEVKNNFSSCENISNIVSNSKINYVTNFSDLNSKHYIDEIQRLENAKIISWTKKWFFEPERGITRAEFLAIVLKSHCYDFSEKVEKTPFYDVDLNSWQAKVVKKSFDLWIISGYSDWTFKPNNEISKIEALAIIYKISNLEIKENFSDSFTDKAASWQTKVLSNLEYLWILNPEKTGNKINPNSKISRNEISKMIVDVLKLY